MILKMFAIYDRVAGFYGAPFFLPSSGEALRAFSDLASDLSTHVGRHPGDFSLFYLGEFDNVPGRFDLVQPEHLAGAAQLLAAQPSLPLETTEA